MALLWMGVHLYVYVHVITVLVACCLLCQLQLTCRPLPLTSPTSLLSLHVGHPTLCHQEKQSQALACAEEKTAHTHAK